MGHFSGNWDNHRQKVMKSVESVKRMVDEAMDAFKYTDSKLAGSLPQTKIIVTSHGGAQ